MGKTNISNAGAAKEKMRMAERVEALGIPKKEMTASVMLAVSALLENLDDTTRELTRARDSFAELEQLVDVDCLAPVPNRRAFMRRLAWAISMHARYGHPCSVLYFDVNNFKRINDAHGHAAGDEVIRHMSKILLESLRDSDFMARLGGDEFAVLLYHARLADARERGRKIAARLAQQPVMHGKEPLLITSAAGAYEIQKSDTPETALSKADAEMYLDKKRMRARVEDLIA